METPSPRLQISTDWVKAVRLSDRKWIDVSALAEVTSKIYDAKASKYKVLTQDGLLKLLKLEAELHHRDDVIRFGVPVLVRQLSLPPSNTAYVDQVSRDFILQLVDEGFITPKMPPQIEGHSDIYSGTITMDGDRIADYKPNSTVVRRYHEGQVVSAGLADRVK